MPPEPLQVQMHGDFSEVMRLVVSNVGKGMASIIQQSTSHTQSAETHINELHSRTDRLVEENNKRAVDHQRLLKTLDKIEQEGKTRASDILRLSTEQERVGTEYKMRTSKLKHILEEHEKLEGQTRRQSVRCDGLELKLKAM